MSFLSEKIRIKLKRYIFEEYFLIYISINHDKNAPFIATVTNGELTLQATLTDANGNVVGITDLSRILSTNFNILFTQDELLRVLAKEIYMQQNMWEDVQQKDDCECSALELEIKKLPQKPHCSAAVGPLLRSFEIRSKNSPGKATEYDTCLDKTEEMVRDIKDENKGETPKTSFFR